MNTCYEPNCWEDRITNSNYCASHCTNSAALIALRSSKSTKLDQMEKSTTEAHGGHFHHASGGGLTMPNTNEIIENNVTDRLMIDIGKTRKNTERHTMNQENETSNQSEKKTVLDLAIVENGRHLKEKSEVSILNLDEVNSASMNIIDESISCMKNLMTSVSDNIKAGNEIAAFKHVDPAQVNAAVNCAREMAGLMRLKLEVLKEMRRGK